MNFSILVKIAKQKVTFWYQSGSSPYASLIIKDSNEVPLYFYVNGTDFIFGDDLALNRFNSNDSNAFGNYFEIIKDPASHFTIAGVKKPVKQLLYHGIEKYLNFFITEVLYKNDSLESYRQNFPLRFWFDSDIEEKEKSLIENLFNEAGYDNIDRVDFNENIFQALLSENVINPQSAILLLNGINNTLYIELYKNISTPITGSSKLQGHGADPSVQFLAEMILEDILAQESYLSVNKQEEIAFLLPYAAARLETITPIIKGDALLTDGKKHYFEVRHRILNERLLYYSDDSIIYAAIKEIISLNNINNQNLTVLMASKEINTPYMINKLLSKYPIVKGVEQKYVNDAIKLIFKKIAVSNYKVNKTSSGLQDDISQVNKPIIPPKVTSQPPLPQKNTPSPSIPTRVASAPPLPPKVIATAPLPPKHINGSEQTKTVSALQIKVPPIIKSDVKLQPIDKALKKTGLPPMPIPKFMVPPPPPPPIKKSK